MRVHVLHLSVGGERYAIPTAHVVEVVPAVPLRALPGAPPEVAGLLAYRGRILPVVDLARRLGRPPAPQALSTRIVVCARALDTRHTGPAGVGGRDDRPLLGVLAADVTRVGELDPDAEGSHAGVRSEGLRAVGRVTFDEGGLVQLVSIEGLLGAELLSRLDGACAELVEAPTAPAPRTSAKDRA